MTGSLMKVNRWMEWNWGGLYDEKVMKVVTAMNVM